MGERLLGIDVGTTGVRAAIFDASGTLLADASLPCPFDAPAHGWAQIRPDAWWRATTRVLAELAARSSLVGLDEITAIGVVGQAPTAALVDEAGDAAGPAILWLDTRADVEARELGVPAYYLGPKLLWLSRHGAPASAARWLLQSHALLVHRLTGEAAIDPSTAALCLPLFDLEARAWIPERCAELGLRPDQLPPVRPAHAIVGHVTPEAASATGLRAGTPVVAGGGDFAAATLGAGVIEEGEACLMLGTAGNLLVPRRTPGKDPRLIHAHHVGADRWLSLGGTLSGGAQEWLRHAVTRAMGEETAVRSALPSFEVLDGEAEHVPSGSEGLLFLPYLQGERTPIWDTEARGAYVGLSLAHGRGHLWRSVLEGIALGFVDCQEVVERDDVRLREVVAANGGGKSALFRQILCDALGVPLTYAPHASGTVAGAALLGGLGTGAIGAATDAKAWRGSVLSHEPDLAVHRRYRELLALRRQAYAGLRPVFSGLGRLRA
jgi:xylulokinase